MSHRTQARRLRARLLLAFLLLLPAGLLWHTVSDHGGDSHSNAERGVVPPVSSSPNDHPESSTQSVATSSPPASSPLAKKTPASDAPAAPDLALLARFQSFRSRLLAAMPRDEVLAALADLKKQVHDLPPDVAAATLIALLKLGEDAPTGLAFVVGSEGVLEESPSYRVALLDLLGQTEPEAIVSYSRSILSETKHPDEYAIALRNLAWLNHEKELDREIVGAFTSLLDRVDWRTAPTTGYLEAFDVAVAIGGPSMLAQLVSVLRLTTPEGKVSEPAVNRAAFIALDRIMLREPDLVAGIYVADPSFMDFAPNHRASLLSRLDPASPAQAQALRTFFQSTPADAPVLDYFARIFPNANYFDGNRLVTSWETPGSARISERDARVIAFVNTLIADPAYGKVAPVLQAVRTRIQSFAD